MKESWRVAAEKMPADAGFPFLPSARYDAPAFGLVTYAFVAPGYAFRRRASLRYSERSGGKQIMALRPTYFPAAKKVE